MKAWQHFAVTLMIDWDTTNIAVVHSLRVRVLKVLFEKPIVPAPVSPTPEETVFPKLEDN